MAKLCSAAAAVFFLASYWLLGSLVSWFLIPSFLVVVIVLLVLLLVLLVFTVFLVLAHALIPVS